MSEPTLTESDSGEAPTKPLEPIALPLGFAGTLRLRLAPAVTAKLLAPSAPTSITTKAAPFPWQGTINNAADPVGCSVVWHIAPDAGAPYDVKHWFPTQLVPGKAQGRLLDVPFTIEETVKDTQRGVQVDLFRLGLYGRGKVGITVIPALRGVQPLTLPPEVAGVTYSNDFAVSLGEPEGAAWPAAPEGRASAVGTPLAITVAAGPLFSGLTARLRLWESDAGETTPAEPSETAAVAPDEPGVQTSWTIDQHPHVEELRLGASPLGSEGFQLWYAHGIEADARLELWWEIRLDDENGMLGKLARPVRRELLCTAPVPTLKTFGLSKAPEPVTDPEQDFACVVEGAFADFASGFTFPVAVRLFLYLPAQPGDPISRPHTEVLSQELPVAVEQDGTFHSRLSLGRAETSRVRAVQGGMMFAVLSFPDKSAPGGRGRPVFMSAARYLPNAVGTGKDDTGFAPFRDGVFATELDATGVCSDLLSLAGDIVELESDAVIVTSWTKGYGRNIDRQNLYNEFILAAAQEFRVDPLILKSLIAEESEYTPDAHRPSGKYAGMTQVSVDLAKAVGCTKFGSPNGPDDRYVPVNAIRAGAHALGETRRSLDSKLGADFTNLPADERYRFIAAAYNLGAGTVTRAVGHLNGRPLTWANLVGVEQIDPDAKDRTLKSGSPLGQAIQASGWGADNIASKLKGIRAYAEDIVARAHQ